MSEENTNDLAVLFPGREVTCKGEAIKVMPLYFGQWPMAGKLAKPMVAVLRSANLFNMRMGEDENGKPSPKFDLADGWMGELPGLLDDGGEALLKFFAFAINKPRDWFDTLPGDEGVALAQAILAENKDFLSRKVLPLMKMGGLFNWEATAAGAKSLPASSATATDEKTSTA